ncbi:MAG: patatin family protein [Atopobiaceae bacterium]
MQPTSGKHFKKDIVEVTGDANATTPTGAETAPADAGRTEAQSSSAGNTTPADTTSTDASAAVSATAAASSVPQANVTDCALVFEGGGTRASYTAGIANVLLDQGIYFGYTCGISAGSSHTLDYTSRDRDRVRRSFIDFAALPDHGGIRSILRGNGYFDADYDYEGCIADGFMPFDWQTFVANKAQVCMSTLDGVTGETLTFHKEDMPTIDEAIAFCRMSSTLPGFMNPITYGGHLMYDGGMGQGAGIPTFMAQQDGYTKFLLIRTRPRSYRKEPPTATYRRMSAVLAKGNPVLREALLTRSQRYNAEVERMEQLEREGRLLMICPESMYIKSTTLDVQKLRDSYLLGYEQGVRELPRIRKFLFGSEDGGPHADPADWLEKIESDRRALSRPLDQPTIDPLA